MGRRAYIRDMIAGLLPKGQSVQTADLIMERLEEEGVLALGYGDADVDAVVQAFADTFDTTKTTKRDRWAAARLVKRHGRAAIVGIIGLLGKYSGQPYAPVVNSVSELEEKLVSVLAFIRKQGDTQTIKVG
jgi:hypothetical protein